MGIRVKKTADGFISNRFAVVVIAGLFFASLAGWIAQELVPPDFIERRAFYAESWRPGVARAVAWLHLHDPFHSIWYRFALALFFAVLVACIITRFRRIALRSLRAEQPGGAEELRRRGLSFDYSWRSLLGGSRGSADPLVRYGERYGRREEVAPAALEVHFERVAGLLRRRGLRVDAQRGGDFIRFTASAGRLQSPGTMLFHIGLVAITVGGLMGSLWGSRELVYLKKGETAPLGRDGAARLRVDDFRIVTTPRGEVRDYLSAITVLDDQGDTLSARVIEVNHPLRHRGMGVYQSSFTIDETGYTRARLSYSARSALGRRTIDLAPGETVVLEETGATLEGVRFLPDFRMGPRGAFTASALPLNPALEVELTSASGRERGWLFLRHPDFNMRFRAIGELALVDIEPLYYTGLELVSNPGSPVLFAGFAAATIGLALMYLGNPRIIKGIASREGLVVAGVECRWRASFEREFGELRDAIRNSFGESGRRS